MNDSVTGRGYCEFDSTKELADQAVVECSHVYRLVVFVRSRAAARLYSTIVRYSVALA